MAPHVAVFCWTMPKDMAVARNFHLRWMAVPGCGFFYCSTSHIGNSGTRKLIIFLWCVDGGQHCFSIQCPNVHCTKSLVLVRFVYLSFWSLYVFLLESWPFFILLGVKCLCICISSYLLQIRKIVVYVYCKFRFTLLSSYYYFKVLFLSYCILIESALIYLSNFIIKMSEIASRKRASSEQEESTTRKVPRNIGCEFLLHEHYYLFVNFRLIINNFIVYFYCEHFNNANIIMVITL